MCKGLLFVPHVNVSAGGLMTCAECGRLQREAAAALQRVMELIKRQQVSESPSRMDQNGASLDTAMADAIGDKARTFGALREHIKEHGR